MLLIKGVDENPRFSEMVKLNHLPPTPSGTLDSDVEVRRHLSRRKVRSCEQQVHRTIAEREFREKGEGKKGIRIFCAVCACVPTLVLVRVSYIYMMWLSCCVMVHDWKGS